MCILEAAVLSGLIAWLFYHSFWVFPCGVVLLPFLFRRRLRQGAEKRRLRLREDFKEAIRVVASSMYAGYSVENAFVEAEKELRQLLGPGADMTRELHEINQQIRLNAPIENLLLDLAQRSGVEEIRSFGQVFGYAKRSGGDFPKVLRDTAERIAEKIELERELATLIAGKALEQKIMNVIPFGILAFVTLSSPGFLDIMYSSWGGRALMTGFLLFYGVAFLVSEKLVKIKV